MSKTWKDNRYKEGYRSPKDHNKDEARLRKQERQELRKLLKETIEGPPIGRT